jgi:hypothetical protein
MKWLVLAALTCNQLVYDQLYEELIRQTIKTQDYAARADAIELLRKLCNDQPFSLELGKKHIN